MPIARRNTPPTSQHKEQLSVLNSLSAWTDTGETEDTSKKQKRSGYEHLPDEEPTMKSRCREFFDVEGDSFNLVIGLVIIGNAIVIGLETEYGRSNFLFFEHLFNFVFIVEMILRIKQLRAAYFQDGWNIFDFALVMMGTLDLWVLPLVIHDTGKSSSMYHFSVMRLLRILRLFRILRVIRLFRMFHQLYLIMQAFNKAFQIVLLISLLVLILDYSCAIVLTQGVGQHAADWGDNEGKIKDWFGTIPASMQTLLLIMTLTNWDDITNTLVEQVYPPLVYVCMVFYIMITSYTMMSLITGIISESLITSQQEFKRRKLQSMDEKRKEVAADLRAFLHEMHEDEKDEYDCVDHEDLKTSVRGDQELLVRLANIGIVIDEKSLMALIDKLSYDGVTRINIDYFVEKVTNLVGPAGAGSIPDLKYEMVKTQRMLEELAKKLSPDDPELLPPPPPKEEERVRTSYVAPTPTKRSSLRGTDSTPKKGRNSTLRFADLQG